MYILKLKNSSSIIKYYENFQILYLIVFFSFLNIKIKKSINSIFFYFNKAVLKESKAINLFYFNYIEFYNYLYLILLKKYIFQFNFLFFRLLKIHGINMRLIILKKLKKVNVIYLRLAYSHGFILCLNKNFLIKVFKKRFILISSFDLISLNNLVYSLRIFKRFFNYKLIGIKLLRDSFKIKIGKKKTI
jgi:hypothetical protein